MKDLESIRKQSLLSLELSSNTKSQITSNDLNRFINETKRLLPKKNLLLILIERN